MTLSVGVLSMPLALAVADFVNSARRKFWESWMLNMGGNDDVRMIKGMDA